MSKYKDMFSCSLEQFLTIYLPNFGIQIVFNAFVDFLLWYFISILHFQVARNPSGKKSALNIPVLSSYLGI